MKVTVVARGLAHPFSLAFLPNGDALVTERGTRLRIIRGATGAQAKVEPDPVAGIPQTPAFRTGGLHEVALHPKFATSGLIYFTYNKAGEVSATNPQQRQSAITLARGTLRRQGADQRAGAVRGRLEQWRERIADRRSARMD